MELIDRENHIKAKYKMKAWVAPNSVPSFTNFAEIELRILNDRGYGYRSTFPRRPAHENEGKQKDESTTTAVATRFESTPPSPARPSVKLPPLHIDANDKSYATEDKPKASWSKTSAQLSSNAGEGSGDLPGMKWAEKWKEKIGSSGSLIVETTQSAKPVEPKQPHLKAQEEETVLVAKPWRMPAHSYSPRAQMHYRINIPQPSSDQMGLLHHHHRSVSSQHSHGNDSVPSSLEIFYQLNQGTFSQSATTGSDISTHTRTKIVASIPHFPLKGSCQKMRALAGNEPKRDLVNIVWENSDSDVFRQSGNTQPLAAPHCESPNLLDSPPSFPFNESPDLQSFPFLPMLPQTPLMPFHGHRQPASSVNQLIANNTNHSVANFATGETRSIGLGPLARKHAACYEWNYYLECKAVKDGKCQKSHVCEICGTAEHRAAQHWHHLATAPLPEIQVQPKLSTFAPPPESPTLSALKDRVPLFVPTPGLETSQFEKLRLRRRQARSKSVGAHTVDTRNPFQLGEMSNSFALGPPPRESRRIPIMVPPSSPSEKPIEVILPPTVRPFQRKSEPREETPVPSDPLKTTISPGGGLRPAAPAFEPSYTGAWTPFASPTSQFGNLFKIPSRESRKIEIVAPKDKGKAKELLVEPAIDVPTQIKQTAQRRNGAQSTVKSNITSQSKDSRNRNQRGPGKRELGSPFSVSFKRADSEPIDYSTDFAVERAQWYMDSYDSCEPSTSTPRPKYKLSALRNSFPTDNLDSSVVKILDEQLDAIIGKASEETIAATLETIIEICSTSSSSSATTPRTAHFEQKCDIFNFAPRLNDTAIPPPLQDLSPLQPPRPSQLAPRPTHNFFSLADFADDDVLFGQLSPPSPRRNSHAGDDRPRSADSTSTAPLTPFGSPPPPASSSRRLPALLVDNTPLKGRVERMMSCAAARGAGQCNCGLGDWFHHCGTV